jgi:hypothetical protein
MAGSKGPGWEALGELGISSIATLDEVGDNLQQLMQDAGQMLTRATARACQERGWD